MKTVPYAALDRSPTRIQLVRADRDADGRLHRSGTAYLLMRHDGRVEWRACGQSAITATREQAEAAVVRAWLQTCPPVKPADGRRRCVCCPQLLPATATRRRRFCSGPCRVRYNRLRTKLDGRVPHVRKRTAGLQMGQLERAATRARVHALEYAAATAPDEQESMNVG